MTEHLHHRLAVMHQNLLHGKLPRSLSWGDAVELVEHFGRVEPHGAQEFAFSVGARREFFRRPHTQELGLEEVSRLRALFKDDASAGDAGGGVQPGRMVVLIDHHGAHIYHAAGSDRAQPSATVSPYDPHGFHRHLIHRKEAHYEGERVPEETSFYQAVAQYLAPASEIALVGHGTGKSRAVEVLVEHLKAHHPQTYARLKAVETVDLSALTEPEREALARGRLTAVA